jgi:hypothetical protein
MFGLPPASVMRSVLLFTDRNVACAIACEGVEAV